MAEATPSGREFDGGNYTFWHGWKRGRLTGDGSPYLLGRRLFLSPVRVGRRGERGGSGGLGCLRRGQVGDPLTDGGASVRFAVLTGGCRDWLGAGLKQGDQFPFQQPLPEFHEGMNHFMGGGNPAPPAVATPGGAEGKPESVCLPVGLQFDRCRPYILPDVGEEHARLHHELAVLNRQGSSRYNCHRTSVVTDTPV